MKRYFVQTYGCQMNAHDSRRMEEVLRADGFAQADAAAEADLLVVNTCSVREKAEHKLMSLLGRFRELKAGRPELVLAVAGCVAQQEGERLLAKAPHVDLIIGPDNINELPDLVRQTIAGAPPLVRTVFDLDTPRFLKAHPHPARREVSAYVTVMKGCDERCTFCIVPYTRGEERYRPAAEILDEIGGLVAGGVREITLLGQTVNSWYDPSTVHATKTASKRVESRSEFADLLRRIARDVPDLKRLRYTSPHPRHLTSALVDAHTELSVLARHVHLPVQSGSDAVLKRMSRRYTAQEYRERVQRLRDVNPDITLSTDIIVGFPGETEADFQQTLALVQDVSFVAAFGFKYSPRPYTPALGLGDDVPEATKRERLARLFTLVEEQQTRHLQGLVGSRQQVLVEGRSQGDAARFTGRTERNEIVHLCAPAGSDPTGELVHVTIDAAFAHSLSGLMADAVPHAPKPIKKLRVVAAH